ncbi:MAG: hypothetical protein IJ389_06225 [Clostridia bacterium]|nr:hypothetical protein [Clostridia bacterium]
MMKIFLSSYYENFSFDNPLMTMTAVVWGLYFGFVIAGFLSYYNKNYLGAVIRALVKMGANSQDKAVTFGELGLKPGWLRVRAITGDNPLSKYVKIANGEQAELPDKKEAAVISGIRKMFGRARKKKYDAYKLKVYIPEEKRIQAEIRYSAKGTSLPVILVGALLAFIVAVIVVNCIPYLYDLIDSVITMYKNLR